MCHDIIWLCDRVMRFQSKTHITPLLAIESPVAQWLEHPTRSRRVVGSNPIWNSDFFPSRCLYLDNFFEKNFFEYFLTKGTIASKIEIEVLETTMLASKCFEANARDDELF